MLLQCCASPARQLMSMRAVTCCRPRLSCWREEGRIARDLEAGEISREEARAALGVLIAAAETPDRADEAPTVFYPAPELRDYVSPHIDYIVDRLLARALLTICGGKPKAGKTTFTFGIVYAMLMGLPFMGLETHKARVLYITEQNKTTIRPKLYEYGLLDSPDLHIMFPRQMLTACMGRHYHPGRHLL